MTSLTSTPTAWGRWRCAPTWTCWSWRMSYGSTRFITKLLALQYRSTWRCTTNLWLMTASRARQTRVRLCADLQVAPLTMLWTGSYISIWALSALYTACLIQPITQASSSCLPFIHIRTQMDVSRCKFRLFVCKDIRLAGIEAPTLDRWLLYLASEIQIVKELKMILTFRTLVGGLGFFSLCLQRCVTFIPLRKQKWMHFPAELPLCNN